MRRFLVIAAFALATTGTGGAAASAPALTVEPITFTAKDGTKVDAERGSFEVPENRTRPGGRMIKIGFVRFRSAASTPGDPIVYLAGGPGGSGVGAAEGPRFPLFMRLRALGDVIALDQRGVGLSNTIPFCKGAEPPLAVATREALVSAARRELARCFAWWQGQGVDIDGYTTKESAHDIEDLRRALGAQRLKLWGISYGSHLGLAVMKYHPDAVNRAVLAGIEGLDQTVKRPALTDQVLARLQALIDADPAAKALYPDVAALMRRVHARLNAEPARITLKPQGAGAPSSLAVDGFVVQLLAAFSIADPPGLARLPSAYRDLDQGRLDFIAEPLQRLLSRLAGGFSGMPEAMDLASGISPQRLEMVRREAQSAVLGDALNFPMPHVLGIRPQIDLGEGFRSAFASAIPTLFISGTLDGRTYPEEAREVLSGFANGAHLIVENGGHNIYEADVRVADAVVAYFSGHAVPRHIRFEPPKIVMP
jgi:pimeloyl-ACP methyl ester carboxylesterase